MTSTPTGKKFAKKVTEEKNKKQESLLRGKVATQPTSTAKAKTNHAIQKRTIATSPSLLPGIAAPQSTTTSLGSTTIHQVEQRLCSKPPGKLAPQETTSTMITNTPSLLLSKVDPQLTPIAQPNPTPTQACNIENLSGYSSNTGRPSGPPGVQLRYVCSKIHTGTTLRNVTPCVELKKLIKVNVAAPTTQVPSPKAQT